MRIFQAQIGRRNTSAFVLDKEMRQSTATLCDVRKKPHAFKLENIRGIPQHCMDFLCNRDLKNTS